MRVRNCEAYRFQVVCWVTDDGALPRTDRRSVLYNTILHVWIGKLGRNIIPGLNRFDFLYPVPAVHKKSTERRYNPSSRPCEPYVVAVLTPVQASCMDMQGQDTGFRQISHHIKTYHIKCNSRKFTTGIKVCLNL